MKVKIESTTTVKPTYNTTLPRPMMAYVPLSCFDKVADDAHVGVVFMFLSAVPTANLKLGLQKVLVFYREWTGRLGRNHKGEDVILLNDRGVRFVEASVDSRLDHFLNFLGPSPSWSGLHPPLEGIDELLQVQVTRFTCGSMVIGFTTHHRVADGHATSNFLVAWGRACRGLDIKPLPLCDRSSFFLPRDPPRAEFDHIGKEYTSRKMLGDETMQLNSSSLDDIVMHRTHFSVDFLAKIKARASISSMPLGITNNNNKRTYSTFECVIAHLWRVITRARSLGACEATHMIISVNGRSRMNPRVPDQYFGNLVLWAAPKTTVKDLLQEPLSHVVKLIHGAIVNVDDQYFRSFIDFTATNVKNDPDIIPTPDVDKTATCPDIYVDSWLRLPFNDIDLGCGSPYMFMPMVYPIEGTIYILPSCIGDGSIDAFVSLFIDQLDCFRQNCYILE